MIGHNMKATVVSGLRWTTFSRTIMQLFTWAATLLVVRMLSPEDYGLAAMATMLSSYLGLLGELGISTLLIQKRTRDLPTLQAAFGALIWVGVLLCVATLAAAPLVATHFKQDVLMSLSVLAAAQFLVMPFAIIPEAILSMDLRFKALGAAGIVSAVVSATSTLALAYGGFGPFALMWGSLFGTVARAVSLNASAPFFSMPRFTLRMIRGFRGFSGYVLAARSIWYWYVQADTLIVGTALGPLSLGIFSVAKQLASIPLDRFGEIVNTIGLPAFSAVQEDLERVRTGYLSATRVGAAIAFPAFAGLAVIAEDMIKLLIGSRWGSAIPVLQLLCMAMPLRMIGSVATSVVTAIGRPDVSLRYVIWAAIFVPGGMVIGIHWGVIGVAAAWTICYPIAFLGGSWHVSRALGCPLQMVLAPLIAPILSATFMVITVQGIRRALIENAGLPLRLTCVICAGFIIYSCTLWALSRPHFVETWRLARSVLWKRPAAVTTVR